ncbi:MAG: hypothetical protein WC263_01270 [Candidatus Micrarchaeia archaeon]|jgi:hypothetical protein
MISISLDSSSYPAGGTINAAIIVSQKKAVKARGLYATLSCTERKQVKTQVMLDKYDFERDREMGQPYASHMETRTETRESIPFSQEKKISGGREFSGEETFSVQFVLPANAAPTSREYGHDNAIYAWALRVKLDIPFAIDENADAEVFVEGL